MNGKLRKGNNNRITAMLPLRNEAKRYLKEVLEQLTALANQVVVLDDASSDDTPEICARYPRVILHRNEEPLFFQHEGRLRAKLWGLTVETEPDWILAIDADELFETRIHQEIKNLINQADFDGVEFRLFDFWKSTTHYRVDGLWNPWTRYSLLLVRYFPGVPYLWPDRSFHCGRWPVNYRGGRIISFQSDIRVKHFGWARGEEHQAKYMAYKAMDPEGKSASKEHLESVIAPPNDIILEEWMEIKPLPF